MRSTYTTDQIIIHFKNLYPIYTISFLWHLNSSSNFPSSSHFHISQSHGTTRTKRARKQKISGDDKISQECHIEHIHNIELKKRTRNDLIHSKLCTMEKGRIGKRNYFHSFFFSLFILNMLRSVGHVLVNVIKNHKRNFNFVNKFFSTENFRLFMLLPLNCRLTWSFVNWIYGTDSSVFHLIRVSSQIGFSTKEKKG